MYMNKDKNGREDFEELNFKQKQSADLKRF